MPSEFFLQEEGREPNNRLSQFSRLLRDKGGLFAEALLEAKDGTLLAPSDEAFEKVDRERLVIILVLFAAYLNDKFHELTINEIKYYWSYQN